jgi:hypothetical protein
MGVVFDSSGEEENQGCFELSASEAIIDLKLNESLGWGNNGLG